MRLLLLLSLSLLAGAASAAQVIVGAARCTWGPAYWCGGGFRQSRECGATRHCIDNVWSKMQVPQDNDDVCTICKNMVTEARDTLRSNETQEELKEVFEGSCALIPIKVIRQECDKLVDEFVPELVETLSSEMNPDLVCTTAGLCNSARIDNLLKSYYASNPRRTECDVCKAETAKVKRKVREVAREDVEDKLLEACGYLGSYSDACRATVIDNFDGIFRMLQRINEQEVCDAVGLCSETLNKIPAVYHSSQPQDVQCEFCEKVIQHWVDTWTANTTQDEFKEVLEALCKKLDRTSRVKHCLHIVDDYYIPWFNFLLHEVNPKLICGMVGLCGGNGFMKVNEEVPITMLLPAVGNELHSEPHSYDFPEEAEGGVGNEISVAPSNRLIGGYFLPQTAIAAEKPGCVICEYAVTELVDYLDNNKTEAAIEKALVRLCLKLPRSVKGQCHDLVVKYGDALIKLLAEDLDPAEICARLGLCPNPELVDDHPTALLDHQASLPDEIQVAKWQDDTCALCEFVMSEVFDTLNDTSDRRMVKNLLESACYRLPGSLENACVKLVNEYSDPIIDAIVHSVDPDMVCTKLQMCASRLPPPPPPRDSKAECAMCKTVMAKLDDMIGDKQNQAEVKEALDKVCGHIPSRFSSQCTDYVDQYGEMIMDLLAQELSPEMVCSQLGFCVKDKVRPPPSRSDNNCALCEFAMSTLERILGDKKNEEEVREALDQVCGYMPKSVSKQCVEYVDAYAEQIIDMITKDLKPHQVCEAIGLCDNSRSAFPVSAVVEQEHERDEGPLCTLCEYTISDLDRYITDPHNEDEVKSALDRVCYELSNPVKDECVRLVNSYLDDLVQMIVSEYTPEEICIAIRMCSPKEEITNNELPPIPNDVRTVSPPPSSMALEGTPFCVVCEFAMHMVESKVLNNRTFDMVERAVEMVCSYMPESVADKCEDFVADYGDDIIRMIVELEMSPKEVCAALTLCATPPAVEDDRLEDMSDARALGGRKCAWGPSYWCKTPFHARQCGTTRHCEEHVWGEERRRK